MRHREAARTSVDAAEAPRAPESIIGADKGGPTGHVELPAVLAGLQQWAPMPDGVRLHSTVTRPDVPYPVPAVLVRTPYLPFTPVELDVVGIAARGVAVVVQSVRGTGASEGEFEPFVHEADDGAAAVAWCAAQPWSNGRVGTSGRSYLALTQTYAAARYPDAITAMALDVVPGRPYDWVYPGGAFLQGMVMFWSMRHAHAAMARAEAAGADVEADQAAWRQQVASLYEVSGTIPSASMPLLDRYFPTWRRWLEHPRDDDWWRARDRPGGLHTGVPALYVGGWHDLFLAGTLDAFTANSHPDSRLIVGPWAHTAKGSALGQVYYGFEASAAAADVDRQMIDFVLERLQGERTVPGHPRVRIFVMGANRWRDAHHWPPHDVTPLVLFPQLDGRLTPTAPTETGELHFEFDPRDPVPTVGGANFFIGSDGGYLTGQWDQRELDGRRDILRFTSDPLTTDVEVIGRVIATIHAATSAASTDWTAKLVDVHPDGRALNVVDGIRRMHAADTGSEDIEPDALVEVEITLGDTAQLFGRGHRIRLDISSSNYPRFDRNPGTSAHLGTAPPETYQIAQQRVVIKHGRPARLTLPVISEPAPPHSA
jgi:putative CocE/NonD family hydrolase